jgi:hypothetical protein
MHGLQEDQDKHIEHIRQNFKKLDPNVITMEEVVMLSTDDDNKQLLKMMTQYIVIKYKKRPLSQLSIADAYAGLGGNTVYFAENFSKVRAYEIVDERLAKIRNNCSPFKNIEYYKDSTNKTEGITAENMYHDVVYLDPPWNPKPYQKMFVEAIKTCDLLYQSKKAEFLFLMVPLRHCNAHGFDMLKQGIKTQGWEDVQEGIVTRTHHGGVTKPSYTIIYARHPEICPSVDSDLIESDDVGVCTLLAQLRLLC